MANIQMTVVNCGPLSPEKAKIVAFAEGTVNIRGEGVFGAFGAHSRAITRSTGNLTSSASRQAT